MARRAETIIYAALSFGEVSFFGGDGKAAGLMVGKHHDQSAGMLVRIAGALDTTVNDLLGEEEPEQGRDLAAELEALNRQLAEREERSRRRWRAFFAAVGILALWGAVMLAAGLIR